MVGKGNKYRTVMKYSSLEIYSLPFYVYFKNLYVCHIRKIYLKRQKAKNIFNRKYTIDFFRR